MTISTKSPHAKTTQALLPDHPPKRSNLPTQPSASARVISSRPPLSQASAPTHRVERSLKPNNATMNAGGGAQSQDGERLSKIMAQRGLCSRREADAYIEQGLVWVDGVKISQLGTRINPLAKIELAQRAQNQQEERRTILLHKPVGYVSGQPEPGYIPAVSLIRPESHFRGRSQRHLPPITPEIVWQALAGIAPAGRLDIDSTGLLVLTQDGRVARQLIGEDSEIEKEYLVRVSPMPSAEGLKRLNHGLSLDGKALRPAKVTAINDDQLKFILKEGKKRQIRRMCELVNIRVVGLKRVRIGRINLADIPVGQWRFLQDHEHF